MLKVSEANDSDQCSFSLDDRVTTLSAWACIIPNCIGVVLAVRQGLKELVASRQQKELRALIASDRT